MAYSVRDGRHLLYASRCPRIKVCAAIKRLVAKGQLCAGEADSDINRVNTETQLRPGAAQFKLERRQTVVAGGQGFERHRSYVAMTEEEQQTILMIKGAISELPPAHRAQCEILVDYLRRVLKEAGSTVGTLAIALIGAELQLQVSGE